MQRYNNKVLCKKMSEGNEENFKKEENYSAFAS